ncbi:MAG: PEP/pyruvate-binding domain-containing protein [Candidatus Omnitrophica bacterium]|nr:PEP/pyruvate-binding domain-containing protein [Candidatus Omnitrophota bacterium]
METTGIKSLDKVINSLRLGDNVVWQIDSLADYLDFVRPFVKQALADKKEVVYLRFAEHEPIITKADGIVIYKLDAYSGFESFSSQVNAIATRHGRGVYYVFDCLSDLLSAWANDLMIGNFFKITCPYLFELDTIAYFALLRNKHSFKTVARIRETTQLLLDVYHYEGKYYVHPLKVWNRYSPTMFLPHIRAKDRFVPIANSADTAKLFSEVFNRSPKSARRNLDYWDRLFIRAEDMAQKPDAKRRKRAMVEQLARLVLARDEKMLSLIKEHFSLEDMVAIKSRMVGTGFIGGKSTGMLLARHILARGKKQLSFYFEPHDSFYIGSDVFYSYIVENGWWKLRMQQKTKDGYFTVAGELAEKMRSGVFPEEIQEQFQQMIEYFGQSPIIVRSSSLLEDSFGNVFAGKYESIFLVNQGTPEERYGKFVEAVRRIYASTMNKDALTYRQQRGLDQADEQMALLVQRVSGAYHGRYFFPEMAGVGISYNTFVWKPDIDPRAGMLRIVAGLGTHAVNRVEGDYPRIAALDQPLLKVASDARDRQRFSQHDVDVLDIETNSFVVRPVRELLREGIALRFDLIASRDEEATARLKERGSDEEVWILDFDRLLGETEFATVMKKMLRRLEAAYGHPVDIEFTVNVTGNALKINLLQCRPLKTMGLGRKVKIPERISADRVLIAACGGFLGGNIFQPIKRIIFVDPQKYSELSQTQKYDIARAVGEINRTIPDRDRMPTLLLGPGRWGTTTPSLGVPVSFSEINKVAALGEVAFAGANASPELSFGTHFFQDLVEAGIFYLSVVPEKQGTVFNLHCIRQRANGFAKLCPDYAKYQEVVRVADLEGAGVRLASDIVSQKLLLFRDTSKQG